MFCFLAHIQIIFYDTKFVTPKTIIYFVTFFLKCKPNISLAWQNLGILKSFEKYIKKTAESFRNSPKLCIIYRELDDERFFY